MLCGQINTCPSPYVYHFLNNTMYEYSSAGGRKDVNKTAAYTIEPFNYYNKYRLKIKLEFTGDASGETKILLPYRFGGLNHLRGIKSLEAASPNTFINDTNKPEEKIVKYKPYSTVVLTYQVEESYTESLSADNIYHAVIKSDYFSFLGETVLIIPVWDWNKNYNFHINWLNIPQNWVLANSFGVNEKSQSVTISPGRFCRTIFTGGDFRIIQRTINNNPVYISIRGNWKFSDAEIANTTEEIIKIQRDFWKDNDFPYYFISIMPIEGYDDYIGVKRVNSFAVYLTTNAVINFSLKTILSFESLQAWMWDKALYASPEELIYWFSQGFSNYYARLFLLRSGMISIKEYVDDYNKVLKNYFTSPVRHERNEKIINSYWTDMDIHELPFLRGDILANNLNASIIKKSAGKKSLDNLMLDVIHRCKKDSMGISNGILSALIRYYAGEDALADIMRTLNTGADIKVDDDALGPCFKQKIDTYRKFWLIGEKFSVPFYTAKNETEGSLDKKCLVWFGIK